MVEAATNRVVVLTNRVSHSSPLEPDSPIIYANDLDVAADGAVYFTTSVDIILHRWARRRRGACRTRLLMAWCVRACSTTILPSRHGCQHRSAQHEVSAHIPPSMPAASALHNLHARTNNVNHAGTRTTRLASCTSRP